MRLLPVGKPRLVGVRNMPVRRGLVRYDPAMTKRPTDVWRAGIAEGEREVASGKLDPECAVMAGLFPE